MAVPVVQINLDASSGIEFVLTKSGEVEVLTLSDIRDLQERVSRQTAEIEKLKEEQSCLPWNEVLKKAGVRRIKASADSNFVKMYCLQKSIDYWSLKTSGPKVRGIPARLMSDFVEQYKRFEIAQGPSKRVKMTGDVSTDEET